MIGAYVEVIATFIGVFAACLILASVEKGSFRRTFEFTGYEFLLPLMGALITVSIFYDIISKAQVLQKLQSLNSSRIPT